MPIGSKTPPPILSLHIPRERLMEGARSKLSMVDFYSRLEMRHFVHCKVCLDGISQLKRDVKVSSD